MAQVLLDIAQNASIRGMRVDGVDLFSVYDFVTYVCPNRNSSYASTWWYRLISNDSRSSQNDQTSNQVMPKWHDLQFNGKGQKNTPCMSILGLQKLLLILGSKAAVEFRDRVLECFNRVLAGDRTLIREITANAAQDGPVQQIARAALAEQAAEDRIEAGECMELEVADCRLALKRKWEVEDRQQDLAERQQALAERRMMLKREAEEWELELAQRRLEQTLSQSNEKQKLAIQQQKLELADRWMECMERLDPNWRADARLQLQAKDRLCNAHMIEPRLAITAGPAQDAAISLQSASLTLKEVADSLKAEFVGRQDDSVLMRAGRTAAQLYAERHGRPPGKHKEMHGGRVIDVNSYTEADRDLLQEAVRQTMRKDSQPVTRFFQPRKQVV